MLQEESTTAGTMVKHWSFIVIVQLLSKFIQRLTTTTSTCTCMFPTKVIGLIYFVVRKVVQGPQMILACFDWVSVQYHPQKRAAGSKGCPRTQGQKTLLVPAEIRTNISVSAYDLPVPKVLYMYYNFVFKLFLVQILIRLNNKKIGTCASWEFSFSFLSCIRVWCSSPLFDCSHHFIEYVKTDQSMVETF